MFVHVTWIGYTCDLLELNIIRTEHYGHNFFGRWKKRHNLGTYFKALGIWNDGKNAKFPQNVKCYLFEISN